MVSPPNTKTYYQYTQEILSGDTIEQIARIGAKRLQVDSGVAESKFDTARLEGDISHCMRKEMGAWLKSGDPVLHTPISKVDVNGFAAKFVDLCLQKIEQQ